MRRFLACCLMLAGLLASTPSALAHRVHLFAYVSSGQIVADCRFSRARPAKHAEVVVYDAASGRELLRGKSDEKGMARLAIPPELLQNPAALRLVVHAGEGHQAEWRLGAEALRGQQAVPPLASTAGDEPPAALSAGLPLRRKTHNPASARQNWSVPSTGSWRINSPRFSLYSQPSRLRTMQQGPVSWKLWAASAGFSGCSAFLPT